MNKQRKQTSEGRGCLDILNGHDLKPPFTKADFIIFFFFPSPAMCGSKHWLQKDAQRRPEKQTFYAATEQARRREKTELAAASNRTLGAAVCGRVCRRVSSPHVVNLPLCRTSFLFIVFLPSSRSERCFFAFRHKHADRTFTHSLTHSPLMQLNTSANAGAHDRI